MGYYQRNEKDDFRGEWLAPRVNNARPAPAVGRKAVRGERYLRDDLRTSGRYVNPVTIGQTGATPEQLIAAGVANPAAVPVNGGQLAGAGSSPAGLTVRGQKIKQVLTLDLSIARTDAAFLVSGNGIVFNDSTNGTDRIKVRFARYDGDVSSPAVTVRPGEPMLGENFTQLRITNAATAGATAEILVIEDLGNNLFRQA